VTDTNSAISENRPNGPQAATSDVSRAVTEAICQIDAGDTLATDRLLGIVYQELRAMAEGQMQREAPGQTLQATALVHEAYLRLLGDGSPRWDNRAHFFGAAGEAMRRILVERARKRAAIKHGGGHQRVPLEHADGARVEEDDTSLLALHEALTRLEAQDPRMANVVKLRYFVGLSIEQTAEALNVTSRTVDREWVAAKAWLRDALRQQGV
jgi:RNA polymerase sigma factor (TIGR02999 family)